VGDVLFPSPTFIHAEAFLSPTGIFSDSSTGKNSGPQARFINHRPGSSKDIKVTLNGKHGLQKPLEMTSCRKTTAGWQGQTKQ